MAFDVYGNYLRPGHCEVHPNVPEPFPCSICYEEEIMEMEEKARERQAYAQKLEEDYDLYLRQGN